MSEKGVAAELLDIGDHIISTEAIIVNAARTQVNWATGNKQHILTLAGALNYPLGNENSRITDAIFREESDGSAARIRVNRRWSKDRLKNDPFAQHILSKFQEYKEDPQAFTINGVRQWLYVRALDELEKVELWVPEESL